MNRNKKIEAETSKKQQIRTTIQDQRAISRSLKMFQLSQRGLCVAEIARVQRVSPITVERSLKKFSKYFKELENVEQYQNNRAALLGAAELQALKTALSPDKAKKASLLSAVTAAEKLYKMGRIERGLSTANIAHGFGQLPSKKGESDDNTLE